MAPPVSKDPSKHEDLKSMARTHVFLKKLIVALYTCKPSLGEAETGGHLGFTRPARPIVELQASVRPRLQIKTEMWTVPEGQNLRFPSDLQRHAH